MILRQLFEKDSSTYTYLIGDEKTGKAVLIDPVLKDIDLYLRLLEELNLKISYALDTHIHADHVTAAGALQDKIGCQVFNGEKLECASGTLSEGMTFDIGNLQLKCLFTPGHTDNSYTFVLENNTDLFLFTGDTLLIRGTGRTDFQNGNSSDLYDSVNRLINFPDTAWVYPGHDYKGWTVSTVKEEKEHNPRLQCKNRQEFIDLMASLKLPNPKMMDVAVPANLKCGRSKK